MCFDSVDISSSQIGSCFFNFKRADFSILNDWLLSCDWTSVLEERDIDLAVSNFYDILYACFAQCVPIGTSRSSHFSQPWLDSSSKHLKNLKNKAWKRFCASGSGEDYVAYTDLCNQFSSQMRASYDEFLSNMRSTLRTNPRQFWKFINSKRNCDGYPSSLKFRDCESSDSHTIADFFADFFRTAFCDINCDISLTDFTHLTRLSSTSLELKDLVFDDATVSEHLSNLSDCFSGGPDGIPASFLKRCSSSLANVLCYLFNLSLCSGRFPGSWKNSVIIPLHKKGDKCDINNYRPIANLCHVAKIFEALVSGVLRFHCRPFMGSFQHGFIRGKSTTTNLLEFLHLSLPAIESGKQVDCIFTDFSKAFDRINHGILVHKLSLLGFPSRFVDWLSSYLSDRTQRVLFRGVLSDEIFVSSGVPQGSILGPLLFILYINDVSLLLENSIILCYADDAKIFRVVSRDSDCGVLNADLATFCDWCSNNHLPLNASKCTTMTFTRRRHPIVFDYSVDGSILSRIDTTKDLGVVLNARLSFEDHVDLIVGRANSMLGFVKRWSRELDDPYLTKLLYCTFVRPILEYASPVWAPYFAVHANRIEAVQRRFLRFALRGLPWNNPFILPPYSNRLELISLDSLEKRRDVSRIVFMFDLLQGAIDSPDLLNAVNISIPARSLRNHDFLHVSFHRTMYGMHEPITAMSRLFNEHFACFDLSFSRLQLKNQLRKHLN